MTSDTLIKAQLVAFAYDEAVSRGDVNSMLAVACVIRNRVQAGWGDWLDVMFAHDEVAGNDFDNPVKKLDLGNTNLQTLMREVEDIYHGVFLDELTDKCVYYCFVERPIRDWFAKHIIQRPQDHPQTATIGTMKLYK
jgi:hypothetical protein